MFNFILDHIRTQTNSLVRSQILSQRDCVFLANTLSLSLSLSLSLCLSLSCFSPLSIPLFQIFVCSGSSSLRWPPLSKVWLRRCSSGGDGSGSISGSSKALATLNQRLDVDLVVLNYIPNFLIFPTLDICRTLLLESSKHMSSPNLASKTSAGHIY